MITKTVTRGLACLLLASLPLLAAATPKIQTWKTSNGAQVFFVPAPEIPMVDVHVIFDAGSSRDDSKEGLAVLTAGLLGEGAGEMNVDQIAQRFEGLGANFGAQAERESAEVSLRSLTQADLLAPALTTLNTILRQPTFPQASFDRERNRMLIGLRAEQQSPEAIAERAFSKAVYGDHPYAHEPSGTEASVSALTRDDVVQHYQRYYVGLNALIAIVGAVDRSQAEHLAEQLMQGVPSGARAAALPPVPPLTAARTIQIPHPSAQTHILIGQPGIKRSDPDYFALYVGNHVLGGSGLVSRLSDEIREKRGLSYSTYSYFLPMREAGAFTLGLQTRNDQVQQALTVAHDTLSGFVTQGPTIKEVAASKKSITGGFALRIDSNRKIVGYLGMIGFNGLALDYLDHFIHRMEAVTAPDIKAAFQRHLDPDKMITVIVGGGAVETPETHNMAATPIAH